MHIINTNNFNEFVKQVKTAKEKPLVVQAKDDEFNRKALEYGKFDILLSPELGERKTKLRQSDSGLNHVLAKIAAKNKIAIGINLDEIRAMPKENKAMTLTKIKQNIAICRKAKTQLAIVTKDKKEALILILTLGASTQQASEAIFL